MFYIGISFSFWNIWIYILYRQIVIIGVTLTFAIITSQIGWIGYNIALIMVMIHVANATTREVISFQLLSWKCIPSCSRCKLIPALLLRYVTAPQPHQYTMDGQWLGLGYWSCNAVIARWLAYKVSSSVRSFNEKLWNDIYKIIYLFNNFVPGTGHRRYRPQNIAEQQRKCKNPSEGKL